jgi:hypothetical protein
MPMRWVLPGGATLRGGEGRLVVCRPNTTVIEGTKPRRPPVPPKSEPVVPQPVIVEPQPGPAVGLVSPPHPPSKTLVERLTTVKVLLEVLAILVGLIGAILALFGLSRK